MKMRNATVAIIGRPNVGKSTLFNALIGARKSIVSDIPHTTRDSVTEKVSTENFVFWLVDTAGLSDQDEKNELEGEIQNQARIAIKNADTILFIVDGKAELTSDDFDIAEKMRKSKVPTLFIVNKIDDGDETRSAEFMKLGLGMPAVISAKNFYGVWELEDLIEKKLQKNDFAPQNEIIKNEELEPSDSIKIAFVGRPNVGKSSCVNACLKQNKVVVSGVAGTTRDAVDTDFVDKKTGQKFTFIDTAGLRRPGKVEKDLEFWSTVRTRRAIERADICVVLIDALDGVTHRDLAVAGEVIEAGKGIIFGVNKFDLVREKARTQDETDEREVEEIKMWGEDVNKIKENYLNYLSTKIPFARWAPILFFSAKTGKQIDDIFTSVVNVYQELEKRVSTSELNRLVPEITFGHVRPSVGTKIGKIKYISQVDVAPPKFCFFVNNTAAFHFSYRRYIENKIREKYGFHGTPIKIQMKDSMDKFKGKR
jgi:GTP-binding protein